MRQFLLMLAVYAFLMLFLIALTLFNEWRNPSLVDIIYHGSYWLYFCDFVLPLMNPIMFWGAVLVIPAWLALLHDYNKTQAEAKKKSSIEEHFGIDYKKKD